MEKTEREKMLAGELYASWAAELVAARSRARRLMRTYNATTEEELDRRAEILRELCGAVGERVWIEPPFYCDYGANIFLGNGVYLNHNCIILDPNIVRIGDSAMLGPAVQIITVYHPLDAADRSKGPELASPVTIGKGVWLGAGAIVCPGVTIGDNSTIGAGSVVVKDIPPNVLAVGNPCRPIRQL